LTAHGQCGYKVFLTEVLALFVLTQKGRKKSRKKDASPLMPAHPRLFSGPTRQTLKDCFNDNTKRADVHERSGPLEACAAAKRLAARRGAAFVLPFLLILFFGQAKKSIEDFFPLQRDSVEARRPCR